MAKIIPFNNKNLFSESSQLEDNQDEIILMVSEMSDLLHCIEHSLKNTPNYATKDINCRG